MRLIARSNILNYAVAHPDAALSLKQWLLSVKAADWADTNAIQQRYPKAKVLNAVRVRFEVAGGNYRLIASFAFQRRTAYVKFIGTHTEYDRVDALTVSQF